MDIIDNNNNLDNNVDNKQIAECVFLFCVGSS